MKKQSYGAPAGAPTGFAGGKWLECHHKEHDIALDAKSKGKKYWTTHVRSKIWIDFTLSLDDYVAKRHNGEAQDNPKNAAGETIDFPVDGDFDEWANPKNGRWYLRYTEGPNDKAWMEERDRNYILRLEREGRLLDVEPNADKEIVADHKFRQEIVQAMQRAKLAKEQAEKARLAEIARRQAAEEQQRRAEAEQQRIAEQQRLLQFQQNCRESGLTKLAKENNLDGIHYLLTLQGIDINTQDAAARTALHYIAAMGNLQLTQLLVQKGADVFPKDGLEKTARDYAIKNEHAEVAAFLRQAEQATQQREQQSPQPIPIRQPRTPQQPGPYVWGPGGGNPAGGDAAEPRRVMRHDGVVELSFKIHYNELTFIKELGNGAFGEVWQGQYKGKDVAIKKLFVAHMSALTEQAFLREAGIMATLDGQYVMRLRKVVLAPDPYCMVMDYMPHGSLHSLLHSNTEIPWATRWQLAMDIGHGLKYLHSEEILHHDLKSENVLLGAGLRAKLADFGLSKVKTETTGTVTSNMPTGSTRWLPPEAFQPTFKYTYSSDIYSYGLVLWEIATRKLPFENAPNMHIVTTWIQAGATENFPNPNECPEEYAVTGKACWHKNPDARPTATQIVERLKTLEEPLKQFGLFHQPAGPAEDPAEYAEVPAPGGR